MGALWSFRAALLGQALRTETGTRFTVTAIHRTYLLVQTGPRGLERTITQREIEAAEALIASGVAHPTPQEIRYAGVSDHNPSYIMPIIKALQGHRAGEADD